MGLEVRPYPYQQEMLEALDVERTVHGRHRNLVVAATGTGKTRVAASLIDGLMRANWCKRVLFLVDRLAAEFSPGRRSLALAIAGWLPLGVLQTVAEGHNDVFLVMPVLLWLALLIGRNASSPLALGASVLSKYATAPLFLADAIHALRQERLSCRLTRASATTGCATRSASCRTGSAGAASARPTTPMTGDAAVSRPRYQEDTWSS